MLSKSTVFEKGQIFVEDDRQDEIVLFRRHRIEEVSGDRLVVARIQPDRSELTMDYGREEFCEQMILESEIPDSADE